jgi:hypothetical protein
MALDFLDPDKPPMRLRSTIMTCWGAPYQWDAFPVSGGYLYLRYRHGRGRVEWAPSQADWWKTHGGIELDAWSDSDDRDLDLEEFCASTRLIPPPLEMQFGRIFDE